MPAEAPPDQNSAHGESPGTNPWHTLLLAFAVFAIIAGLRIVLVAHFSAPAPFWDEWDAEGAHMYPKVLSGQYELADVFAKHNEHRIAFTKAVFVGLLHLHGAWDPLLQMIVSALLHGVFASILFFYIHAAMPARGKTLPAFLLTLLLTAIPFDHDNAIAGFQSQFEFLQIFSLLALVAFGGFRPLTPGWWTGWVFLVCASLSMGSGFFPALAILVTYALFAIPDRSGRDRAHLIGSILLALFASVALISHFADSQGSRPGLPDVAASLLSFISWPLPGNVFAALAVCAPTAAGILLILTGRLKPDHRLVLTTALSVWYFGQACAIALSRSEPELPSRYLAIIACGIAGGALWTLHLLEYFLQPERCSKPALHRLPLALASLWMAGISALLVYQWLSNGQEQLIEKSGQRHTHAAMLGKFMQSRDPAALTPPRLDVFPIYPSSERLAEILGHAPLLTILPSELQPQLLPQIKADSGLFSPANLPPGLAPPPVPVAWGSHPPGEGLLATGQMTLQFERNAASPWVEFWVAGAPSPRGTSLIVQDTSGQRRIKAYTGTRPGAIWTRVLLEVPYSPFQLVAEDKFDERWFAFTAPRSVGKLEPLKTWLLKNGGLAIVAGVLIATLVFMQVHFRRPDESTSSHR